MNSSISELGAKLTNQKKLWVILLLYKAGFANVAKPTFKDDSSRGGLDSGVSRWKGILSFHVLF